MSVSQILVLTLGHIVLFRIVSHLGMRLCAWWNKSSTDGVYFLFSGFPSAFYLNDL